MRGLRLAILFPAVLLGIVFALSAASHAAPKAPKQEAPVNSEDMPAEGEETAVPVEPNAEDAAERAPRPADLRPAGARHLDRLSERGQRANDVRRGLAGVRGSPLPDGNYRLSQRCEKRSRRSS